MPIQQSQQKRADVRPVDVRVREQDRPAVAELLDVEVIPYPGAERGDKGLDFLIAEHFVRARLLDVEDLPPEGQDRLEAPVSATLGAAAGRDALDDDELAFLWVALRAVGEFAGQRESVESALTLDEVTCFARRLSCAERGEAFLNDAPCVRGVFLEVLAERVVHRGRDLTGDLGIAEPRLGLALELRLADLDADHGC